MFTYLRLNNLVNETIHQLDKISYFEWLIYFHMDSLEIIWTWVLPKRSPLFIPKMAPKRINNKKLIIIVDLNIYKSDRNEFRWSVVHNSFSLWHDMCNILCTATDLARPFWIFRNGRCIAGIYTFHCNPIFPLSVYFHVQVQSPNDGHFSAFYDLPSHPSRSYYLRNRCVWSYKSISILKP